MPSNTRHKIAVVLGCINGANDCVYMSHTVDHLESKGYKVVFCHWRHALLENPKKRHPRNFNCFTTTKDMNVVLRYLKERFSSSDFYLIGLSMGGNMLVRWAAEYGIGPEFAKGVFTLGSPFCLYQSTVHLSRKNSLSQLICAIGMVRALAHVNMVYKELVTEKMIDIDWGIVERTTSPLRFSEEFGYKIFKHENPEERHISFESYMSKMSSMDSLAKIRLPCMMVSSKDDPISNEAMIPWDTIKNNTNLMYVYTPRGGHLTFSVGWKRERWYKDVMSDFLQQLDETRED